MRLEPGRLSFLDGLRGIAASAVVVVHAMPFFPGHEVDGLGQFAVFVFFALSGFVLARLRLHSPLTLEAQIARRALRLFIPITAVLLATCALRESGAYALLQHVLAADPNTSTLRLPEPSYVNALEEDLFLPFHQFTSRYDPPLWTMHVEYAGSALVLLQASPAVGRRLRIASAALLAIVLPDVDLAPFMLGSLVACLTRDTPRSIVLSAFACAVCLAARLIVDPGIAAVIASAATAVGLLLALLASERLRVLLASGVLLALGRLSFGIYLLNLPIIDTIGLQAYCMAGQRTGHATAAAAGCLATGLSLWACAVFFERYVDQPSVMLSRKVGEWIDRHRNRNAAA